MSFQDGLKGLTRRAAIPVAGFELFCDLLGKQAPSPLEFAAKTPDIHTVPQGTMNINARVISGSDPGAVPGGSTRFPVV